MNTTKREFSWEQFWVWSLVGIIGHVFVYFWLLWTGSLFFPAEFAYLYAVTGTVSSFVWSHRWGYMLMGIPGDPADSNNSFGALIGGFLSGVFVPFIVAILYWAFVKLGVNLDSPSAPLGGLLLGLVSFLLALAVWRKSRQK